METRISGHTRLFALIGSPVGHSGSPAMYNYSFARLGIDAAYLAFDIPVDKVGEGVAALKMLNVGGFNVTMPCKREVLNYVDEITPAAKLIGASNTVVITEEGKHYKLDYYGKGRYIATLAKSPSDRRCGKNNISILLNGMF